MAGRNLVRSGVNGNEVGVSAVRSYEWSLTCPVDDALPVLRHALEQAGFAVPHVTQTQIQARAKTSWMKNRYAATLTGTVTAAGRGTLVSWSIEMAGDKHDDVLAEVAVELPPGALDDHGVAAAMQKLDKASRRAGRRELARLGDLIAADEQVVALGQGLLGRRPGIVVLTDQRLFFYAERSGFTGDQLEQFDLPSIQRLTAIEGRTGDRLEIVHPRGQTDIKELDDGQAAALVAAFDAR